jgi:hypothetical protein
MSITPQTTPRVKSRAKPRSGARAASSPKGRAIRDVAKLAAEAEQMLEAMRISIDILLTDRATADATDYEMGVENIKLTDLPELLADPVGFVSRRFPGRR